MDHALEKALQPRPEQLVYAGVLEKGMFFGLILTLITYLIYITGILSPYVSMNTVTTCWTMNVHDYLQHCNIKPGWGWLELVRYGDFLNFVGIALLAGVTMISFLAIIPVLWRQDDKLYAFFALLEAVILGVAASGILGSGGH